MKNSKVNKITFLILCCAIMIAAAIGISASAEVASDTTLEIANANVAYNDMMHLAFTLEGMETIPEGAEAGIIIWNEQKATYTAANASFTNFEKSYDGDTVYFKSEGIAAPEINTELYLAACYKLDGMITITETPFKYSIVDYYVSRLNGDITEVQSELYYSVLVYGLASDAVLDDDSYVLVEAVNGSVGENGKSYGLIAEVGGSITLVAEDTNASGGNFVKWVDSNGETVSETANCTIIPETAGVKVYTAVYDNAD